MQKGKELAVEQVAVCMMGGVVVWVERARLAPLDAVMKKPRGEWPQFIEVDGEMINPSRVEGIFSAARMEEMQRRKNGEWQCFAGEWHDRFEKCRCEDPKKRDPRKVYRIGDKLFSVPMGKVAEWLKSNPQAEEAGR